MKIQKSILSIACITLLASIALLKDVDGVLFAAAIAAIAGLGGFIVGKNS